jgi:ATP-dependent exoDNAse (exonuclease V) alpha subunit
VGAVQAKDVAGVLDHRALHPEADAEEGHAALPGPADRADLALEAALAEAPDATFHQGDHVIGLRNDHRHDLLNGTRAIVESATQRGDLRLRLADGTRRIATADYIADGHLGHGYALTVHKAQGITVDSSFLLANDATYKELAYTGLSRGRNENLLYSVVDQPQWESAQTLSRLRRTLVTERAKTAAIDHKPHLGIER